MTDWNTRAPYPATRMRRLRQSEFARRLVREHSLVVAHAEAGRIENDLRVAGFVVTGTDYADRATLHVATPPDQQAALASAVAVATGGGGVLVPGDERWVDAP